MALAGKEATIADVVSIAVECIDCGRNRWWKPAELKRHGVRLRISQKPDRGSANSRTVVSLMSGQFGGVGPRV
ncbi:hypothetical protein NKJ36_07595, partial [Mesorhizobium sp. M0142]